MVVGSPTPQGSEKLLSNIDLPIVDLSAERSAVSKLIVKACEDYGFFKVINHGVSQDILSDMDEESLKFFAKTVSEKQKAGPASPFGYGFKNIGFNGDVGEVEYLLLNANPLYISENSKTISQDPPKFSSAVCEYTEAVRGLACEILELVAEGLEVSDRSVFSSMIKHLESDSVLRLNHYPAMAKPNSDSSSYTKIGFGEHSDPQILTILRSNDVEGLQISLQDGVWAPVTPDPRAFCVNVGDVLQVMTNGRFVSVRHRAIINSYKSRLSIAYFGAPPLNAWITTPPTPTLVSNQRPPLYRPFTWAEYKKATYSLRLGDSRMDLFSW